MFRRLPDVVTNVKTTGGVHDFAAAAETFCHWAEGASSSPAEDAFAALQHLSHLYQQALGLPDLFGEAEPCEVTQEDWARIYKRFGSLPFTYYAQYSNPNVVPGDAPEVADLADDLADVWRDVKRGLSLFDAGHIEAACWNWRFGFWHHWGRHAAGGIYALHAWIDAHSSHGDHPLSG